MGWSTNLNWLAGFFPSTVPSVFPAPTTNTAQAMLEHRMHLNWSWCRVNGKEVPSSKCSMNWSPALFWGEDFHKRNAIWGQNNRFNVLYVIHDLWDYDNCIYIYIWLVVAYVGSLSVPCFPPLWKQSSHCRWCPSQRGCRLLRGGSKRMLGRGKKSSYLSSVLCGTFLRALVCSQV